jgi:hypothetical protein
MKKILNFYLALLISTSYAQTSLTYQTPSDEILELADVDLAPGVQIDSKGVYMVLIYRNQYKSIAELSETEMRLAGLSINPTTNIGSRTTFYTNLKVKKTFEKDAKQVSGLPKNARLSEFLWSPDESMIACLNTTDKGVEVWVLDVKSASVNKVTDANINANINANMGSTIS